MNEQQRRTARQRQRTGGAPDAGSSDFAPQPLGNVTVAHGIFSESLPIREMSVAAVRARMADVLDIHPESVALLDAEQVGEDAIVRAGQRLVFVRRAGEKGSAA